MKDYYRAMDLVGPFTLRGEEANRGWQERFKRVCASMEEFYRAHPDTPAVLLKSRVHTVMAGICEPVIFPGHPFFFEIGMNQSRSWGLGGGTPANWVSGTKTREIQAAHPFYVDVVNWFRPLFDRDHTGLCGIFSSFDTDHQTLGYTTLFETGYAGLIRRAEKQRANFKSGSPEYAFIEAVIESCRALIAIAHRFADKAGELLASLPEGYERADLERIASAARKIPENPPETFYEGLAMLLFTREVTAVIENMGISQLGHVDRLLGDLYKRDLAAGRITEAEARHLIGLFMLHTDIKFDTEHDPWPETSTCIQLGGSDADGKPIFNAVTRMFIEEHHKLHLINPKLNCRYTKDSPREYFRVIGRAVLAGHNNFALIGDEPIIAGLKRSGVSERDARRYVNGGCQETMIEGLGHTEGAAIYISLLRLLDLFLRRDEGMGIHADLVRPLDGAETFEEFYNKYIQAMRRFFTFMTDGRNYQQSVFKEAITYPLYSATQEGCIENGRDHIRGGAKYNFSTVAMVGFPNTADSLYAIRELVYNRRRVSLEELISALEKDWEGQEALRRDVLALPKYGHGEEDPDALAKRLLTDLSAIIRSCKNERGGHYLPSTFVYRYNRLFAPPLRATPDGRRAGDYMAAGVSPSTLVPVKDITQPLATMKHIDFSVCGGGISVLDMMLPASAQFDEEIFASFMKACSHYDCVTLQPNVLKKEELIDAKAHPGLHRNLIVRICGLSAYFTALEPKVQDEIIGRNYYEG